MGRQKILIAKLKQNPQALLQSYEEIFSTLYAYFARRVAETAEIKFLVRATFLRAWAEIGRAEKADDCALDVWLYRRARLEWEKQLASRRHRSLSLYLDRKAEQSFCGRSPVLQDLFKELSPLEAELVRLKYFEKLTNMEIAQVLNIPSQEAGNKLYRALKKAAGLLGKI